VPTAYQPKAVVTSGQNRLKYLSMELHIKRLDPTASLPGYKTPGAACFDLATIETKKLAPQEIYRFRTGLVYCIPKGHFMLVASRSSNAIKKGISMANGIGVIDSDYCGETDELYLTIQNITDHSVAIEAGDRIAQALILPAPQVEILEIMSTGQKDRGGFGSTGR